MVGDDLEGVLTAQVEGGEDGQETLRDEQEEYRQEEVRRTASMLKMNGSIRIIKVLNSISVIPYPYAHYKYRTKHSGHQTGCTGEESQQVSA